MLRTQCNNMLTVSLGTIHVRYGYPPPLAPEFQVALEHRLSIIFPVTTLCPVKLINVSDGVPPKLFPWMIRVSPMALKKLL